MQDTCMLVVDDHLKALLQIERAVQKILKDLGEEGTKIIRAESGFELLDRATAHDATTGMRCKYMLLTDGDMPGMDGIELIDRMRTSFGDQLIHAVVLSAGHEYKEPAEKVNAAFLYKPASIYTGMMLPEETGRALKEQIIFFLQKTKD